MTIRAPDVSLTDFLIAVLCLYFALRLFTIQSMAHDLRRFFVGMFLFTALGAAAGGAFHGFFEGQHSRLEQISWVGTMLALGCTAFYLWHIAFYFGLPQRWRRFTSPILQLGILGFAYYVGYVNHDFIVAVAAYLPAAFFLLVVLVIKFFKAKDSRMLLGILGLLLTLAAAFVQTQKIGIHPEYFNHNALYHLIQAFGLYFIYRFAVRVVVWN